MSIKEKYLASLINTYNSDFSRENLGCREVITLNQLINLAFPSNSYAWPSDDQLAEFTLSNILDLGAGDNFLESSFIKLGSNYFPLDFDRCNFESEKFPFSDCSMDLVISLAVLEHITDPNNYFSEIFRVLKPNGLIWISTPNWQMCFKDFYNDYTHVKPYTPTSLKNIAKDFDFADINIYPNLRVKPNWCYQGPYKFARAKWLFPLRRNTKFKHLSFLMGSSKGLFLLARKPFS